jgi:hypothetical protein
MSFVPIGYQNGILPSNEKILGINNHKTHIAFPNAFIYSLLFSFKLIFNNFYFPKHKMLSQQSISNLRSKYRKMKVSQFFSMGKKLSRRCSDLSDLIDQSTSGRKRDYYTDKYEKEREKLDIWRSVLEQMETKEQQYNQDEKIIAYGKPGRILRVNRNGTYDIRFNNGDFQGDVSPSNIRHRLDNRRFFDSDDQTGSDGSLQREDKVMVRSGSGKEYPGRITHIHRNGTYDVRFDNGDFQEYLSPSTVRRKYARRRDRGYSGSSSDEQTSSFRQDDMVWVRFRGGREYLGHITHRHRNGTFDVRFLDGDFKKNISPSVIRRDLRSPSPSPRARSSCSIM